MDVQELAESLQRTGFTKARDTLPPRGSLLDWFAYKKSKLPARECELYIGQAAQIRVTPYLITAGTNHIKMCEVSIKGKVADVWFELKASSLSYEKTIERMPEVERMLVAAWNALAPSEKS